MKTIILKYPVVSVVLLNLVCAILDMYLIKYHYTNSFMLPMVFCGLLNGMLLKLKISNMKKVIALISFISMLGIVLLFSYITVLRGL